MGSPSSKMDRLAADYAAALKASTELKNQIAQLTEAMVKLQKKADAASRQAEHARDALVAGATS